MPVEAEQDLLQATPEELEEQARQAAEAERERREALLKDLAATVESKFETRRKNRSGKERQWQESMRLYYGSLAKVGKVGVSPDRPFSKEASADRPDYNIVRTKCDIAIAQLISQQFAGGDKNWDLVPSGEMDAQSCIGMENTMVRQLDKSKYGYESRTAIEDRVILGSAVLKGPVNTSKVKSSYKLDPTSAQWAPVFQSNTEPSYVRVDPWYFYPDDSTNDFCSSEDTIELHPLSKTEMAKYSKHPGFIRDAIIELLKEDPKDYSTSAIEEASALMETSQSYMKNKYMVLEYHGPVTSEQLETLGIVPSYDSVDGKTYYGEVWVCQGKVIRVELANIEDFELPYQVCEYKRDPVSPFGVGLPLLVRDAQRVVTQSWHMVLDNSAISSGPQVVMQKDLIEPVDGDWEMRPRKAWFLTDLSANVNQAFQFFVPPNVSGDLMAVLNAAKQFAEEESGIPLMSAGLQNGTAVTTDSATGLGLLQQASTTLLDLLNEMWDDKVTTRVIKRLYAWNMQYNPDPMIKGNFEIDVKSSSDYRNKQLYIRDMEKLSLEASQNPQTGKYVNLDELLVARLSMMHLPSSRIIRTPEEVAAYEQQMAQAQGPNPELVKLQLEERRLALEEKRAALEELKLEFEFNQAQQREAWEFQERQANTYARVAEAEAQVVASQNEKDVAMLNLAAKDEQFRAKLGTDLEIARMREETKAFLSGQQDNRKQIDQLLTAREQKLKRETGSGI
jgi:hypothetical protein